MKLLRKSLTTAVVLMASLPLFAYFPNEKEARLWCDTNVLSPVEGIWEYPEDGARVMIQGDPTSPGTYTITVLTTPDCRLETGDVIGSLHPSIDSHQFRMVQYTHREKFSFKKQVECRAILSADGEILRVKAPKMKLKVNLNTLLPRFWRLIRVSYDNPAEDIPAGLVKVYPGYDHNGSLKRKTRVL